MQANACGELFRPFCAFAMSITANTAMDASNSVFIRGLRCKGAETYGDDPVPTSRATVNIGNKLTAESARSRIPACRQFIPRTVAAAASSPGGRTAVAGFADHPSLLLCHKNFQRRLHPSLAKPT